MITLFNIWHYIVLLAVLSIFVGGIFLAYKEENSKYRFQIIFAFFLVFLFLASVGLYAVDKSTKTAKLYKLENKRNLSTEKVIFSGIIKNEGKYEIGKVYLEIKLLNSAQEAGALGSGSYFVPSGFIDSFLGFGVKASKPSQVTEEFVIAENLKPGEVRDFLVYVRYPPYFQGFSAFADVSAH